jgi:hypothetical protein
LEEVLALFQAFGAEHFGSEIEWRVVEIVEGMEPTKSFRFRGYGTNYLPLHTLHTFHTLHSYKERIINNKRRLREDLKKVKEMAPEIANSDA